MNDLERQMMELSSRMGPKLIGPGVMSNRETEKLGGMMATNDGNFFHKLIIDNKVVYRGNGESLSEQEFKMLYPDAQPVMPSRDQGTSHSMDDGTFMPGATHAEYEAMEEYNEPRMQERSSKNQMFTIQNEIDSLTNEYDMNVRNKQYEQAQQIADVIDQLQQQKIAIQARVGDQQMMSEQSTSGGIGAFAGGGGVSQIGQELLKRDTFLSSNDREMFIKAFDRIGTAATPQVVDMIKQNYPDVSERQINEFMSYFHEPAARRAAYPNLNFTSNEGDPGYINKRNMGGIMSFAGGGGVDEMMPEQMMSEQMMPEEMMPEMGQEQAMGEFEMSKQELMNELFIPLAENGYEKEVMAILENPIDSEESTEAQRILSQVLSQEADFNVNDFLLAVSMVAPQ